MATELYPISVRLVGVLHKKKSKMYMTSVLWTDQNEVVVYRSFEDFKDMHKQLKTAFPSASKLSKSDRILPKFKGIKMKQSQGKGSNKPLVCLKYLQKYCNELLSCDPQVSQSAVLIRFFQAKVQELQPEFTKNSIMIVPSEDEIRSNGGHSSSGNVTQPFVTETYRCVAAYETKDTKNKPFKASAEEKLDVLIKDKGGWWLVENENKRMAWFPAPYLEKVEDKEDDEEEDGTPDRGTLYVVVKSYKSSKFDEVSANMGAVVEVLQKSENGWWLVRHNGKVGYIPTLHLKPYSYPHIQMAPESQALSNSSSLLALSPSVHHSRSHANLSKLPPVTSSSTIQRSRSMLSEAPHPRPARRVSDTNLPTNLTPVRPPPPPPPPPMNKVQDEEKESSPPPPPIIMVQDKEKKRPPPPLPIIRVQDKEKESPPSPPPPPPPPIIMVQDEEEESGWILTADSDDSLENDSFSDDSVSVSGGSSLSLSCGANDERLRLSRTPPPTVTNLLSPSQAQGRLLPSVSDPNLYKGPALPKVPPRPRAQEIMSRCSSVTRKNAAKNAVKLNLHPTRTEITS